MENGFKQRLERIKSGYLSEPRRHTFAESAHIDAEAQQLYEQIEKLEYQMSAWKNRKRYIDFICGNTDSPGYFRSGLYIDELDDELLDIFKQQYAKASNEDKREFARSLMGLVFDYSSCSTEENMNKSRANFTLLKEWLDLQDTNDGITRIINKSFVEQIQESNLLKQVQ